MTAAEPQPPKPNYPVVHDAEQPSAEETREGVFISQPPQLLRGGMLPPCHPSPLSLPDPHGTTRVQRNSNQHEFCWTSMIHAAPEIACQGSIPGASTIVSVGCKSLGRYS